LSRRTLISLFILLLTVAAPASAQLTETGSIDDFQRIIDTRCITCHTRERVDMAIRQGRSFQEIQQLMLARGAVLTEKDKDVLGTFWGNPMKKPGETSAAAEFDEGLREYRRIIQTRCILCHSADRIDEAISKRLPFESVEEILLKRDVVLTEREQNVLGTFWGNPLKEK
jgi:mono/diheme cytochrome c family protein